LLLSVRDFTWGQGDCQAKVSGWTSHGYGDMDVSTHPS